MKKTLICLLLMIAVMMTMIPLITAEANADTTNRTTLLKTKTVTIKPGKTYKTPKIITSEGTAFVIPIEIGLSPKDKKKPKNYIKSGALKLALNSKQFQRPENYKISLKCVGKNRNRWYRDWIYYYDYTEDLLYPQGTFWYTMKNTTKRTIKVKYSVLGYHEIASAGDFPDTLTLNQYDDVEVVEGAFEYNAYKLGTIGPGIPAVKSVKIMDDDHMMELEGWRVTLDGSVYALLWTDSSKPTTATISVQLLNRDTPYNITTTLIPPADDDDWDDEDDWDDDDE